MARLLDQYNNEISPALAEKFNLDEQAWRSPSSRRSSSTWASARRTQDKDRWSRPSTAWARSAARSRWSPRPRLGRRGFRLREGNEIGCKVTLRGRRMYEFLDRLISIALPRIRDFRGVNPNSFDGHGNYSLGLAEQVVFPEIDADKVQHTQGMDITIVTTTQNDDQARELLRCFGMPFRETNSK